jgi:hypothetical protein
LFEYDETTAGDIAADFAVMLQDHVKRGIHPVGVIIDNGSNLVRAFDAPEKAEELGDQYQKYIATESAWAGGQDAPLGWAMKAWGTKFTLEFVHVAQVITELPASEAVVERLFSVLTSIFDLRRRRSELDLIQAETIRMWQIHHPGDFAFVMAARA